MINSYCENLEDLFAQMVYYGVLKDEDAQCFSVSASIEMGSFVLASASLVLTFLCSFVVKAVAQYLRDETEAFSRPTLGQQGDTMLNKSVSYSERTSHTDDDDDDEGGEVAGENGYSGTIHPVPVLFTDSFRWLLRPDPNMTRSSARALFTDAASSHWSLPEATVIVDDPTNYNVDDDRMIKGTYVSDLGSPTPSDYDRKVKEAARSCGSLWSVGPPDAMSDGSTDYDRVSSSSGRKLTYDDYEDDKKKPASYRSTYQSPQQQQATALKSEKRDSTSSLGKQSVRSKMDSSMDSYRDEDSTLSENESLAYSIPSSMGRSTLPPPPSALLHQDDFVEKSSSSPPPTTATASPSMYKRKAPPPSGYRLSDSELKKSSSSPPSSPPAVTRTASQSYFKRQEISSTASISQPPKTNLKKPPPPPSSSSSSRDMNSDDVFINQGYRGKNNTIADYDFIDDILPDGDDRMDNIDHSNDSMFMDDDDDDDDESNNNKYDGYFGENYSHHQSHHID
jgi:hypothetical protein